jgi:hypothetical protein
MSALPQRTTRDVEVVEAFTDVEEVAEDAVEDATYI